MAETRAALYLTPEFVKEALSEAAWNFGNQVLYDLCADNPSHTRADIIIAKVWLIGRSYAAAIERRKSTEGVVGDAFYESVVAPKILSSGIDGWFRRLAVTPNNDIASILETHLSVTRLFTEISGLEQRSLASKYLHFHFPALFYIYDERAVTAIARLIKPIGKKMPTLRDHDEAYSRFFLRCRDLSQQLASPSNRHLSPREVDKVLLAFGRLGRKQ